jgi:UDP-glucose 4-epimerase
MLKIIKNDHFKGETFFVSDGRAYSYSEVFAEICKALGRRGIAPINIPFPAAMLFGLLNEIFLPERERVIDRNKIREMAMDSWLCSNAKAVNELGFKPEYTLANGMAKTIGWYRANGCL